MSAIRSVLPGCEHGCMLEGAALKSAQEQLAVTEAQVQIEDVEIAAQQAAEAAVKAKKKNGWGILGSVVHGVVQLGKDVAGVDAAIGKFIGKAAVTAFNVVGGQQLEACIGGNPGACAQLAILAVPGLDIEDEAAIVGENVAADVTENVVEDATTSVAEDAATSCANSFTANTPVLMADGKQEPISTVRVGDEVLATDPQTGITEARPVQALIHHSGPHTMVKIVLSNGAVIDSTAGHPFWDATTRSFTDAVNLRVGEHVLTAHAGGLSIAAEHPYDRNLTAYNLQVEGIHTYYAGRSPVLVHNSCDISSPDSFAGATRAQAEEELQSNGWYNAGSTSRGGGVRWRQSGNIADQVRIMPGNPADQNLIKQGPYIRFSISGTKYGPYPLADF